MTLIELAREAHRKACPMINCVDCLFGICDAECDYQKSYDKELENLLTMKEMIINVPCKKCNASQCEVLLNDNGWMTILCVECKEIIAEGYSLSPWKLLESI